jgi:triacylglycerol lipase
VTFRLPSVENCLSHRHMLVHHALFIIISLVNLQNLPKCFATFTPAFRNFLISYGGEELDTELSRADLGPGGSHGGGTHQAGEKTRFRPVILVHGTIISAGTLEPIRQHFLSNGYGDEEVYATTYGDAGNTSFLRVKMECDYVKKIRKMILTVSNFTSNDVDVIGISMGTPISRKAILGGICVDTEEDIGPPLSELVYTYVGVAGPNWGSFLCAIPIYACNLVNGMHCSSKFLKDINSKKRYEGKFIYTIASTGDDLVGYRVCGRLASSIDGEDDNHVEEDLTHFEVIFQTVEIQYNFITYGQAEVPEED